MMTTHKPFDSQMLADIEAIKQLKGAYGDIIDRLVRKPEAGDRDALGALFSEDAVVDFQEMLGVYSGRTAIVQFFADIMPTVTAWMWHSFHGPIITVKGDQAEGRWTLYALSARHKEAYKPPTPTYGRYIDKYVRTAEGWRQSHLFFLDETRRTSA
jgi:ketosteroid isomerase-like protein